MNRGAGRAPQRHSHALAASASLLLVAVTNRSLTGWAHPHALKPPQSASVHQGPLRTAALVYDCDEIRTSYISLKRHSCYRLSAKTGYMTISALASADDVIPLLGTGQRQCCFLSDCSNPPFAARALQGRIPGGFWSLGRPLRGAGQLQRAPPGPCSVGGRCGNGRRRVFL